MRSGPYASDRRQRQPQISSRRGGGAKVVAVTGGAGFIGSHACEALVERGCEVVCIDNFQTGSPGAVAHLTRSGRFSLVRHDITQPLPKSLPKLDEIYHFACPAAPVHPRADRMNIALTCALGTVQVLERAQSDGARLLLASSSEVYGDPEVHPQPESYRGRVDPVGPRACYGEAKRFAETLVTASGAQRGLSVKIVRIFNTYGPRMQIDDGRLVSNLIVQALSGRDLTLYGDGGQTRAFCYVGDLVEGCLAAMATPESFTGPVNLGGAGEISVEQLADAILDLTASRSRVVYRELPADDPRRRTPDITLARTALGWSPRVTLREGLERTIESFVERLNATPEPACATPVRA